jgi:hypothetical protein
VLIHDWLYGKGGVAKTKAAIDFTSICSRLRNKGPGEPANGDLDMLASDTLEGLRVVFEAHGLHADLIELAVIDNESLAQEELSGGEQPEFEGSNSWRPGTRRFAKSPRRWGADRRWWAR